MRLYISNARLLLLKHQTLLPIETVLAGGWLKVGIGGASKQDHSFSILEKNNINWFQGENELGGRVMLG
jgi:hypothetical protein